MSEDTLELLETGHPVAKHPRNGYARFGAPTPSCSKATVLTLSSLLSVLLLAALRPAFRPAPALVRACAWTGTGTGGGGKRVTWRDVYENPDLRASGAPKFKWHPVLEAHGVARVGGQLVLADMREGVPDLASNHTVLVSNAALMHGPNRIDDFFVSHAASHVLLVTITRRVFRNAYAGEYWLCALVEHAWPAKDTCVRVEPPVVGLDAGLGPRQASSDQHAELQNPTFSPDSSHLAFVYKNDVYLLALSAQNQTHTRNAAVQITTDGRTGRRSLFNGVPDWVVAEEILESAASSSPSFLHDVNEAGGGTIKWSHDGAVLAFWKVDDKDVAVSHVESFDPLGTKWIAYPTPGTPNPRVSVAMYELDDGKVREIQFETKKERMVWSVDWYPDSRALLMRVTNRAQDLLSEYIVTKVNDKWVPRLVREIKYADLAWIEFGGPPDTGIQRLLNSTHRIVLQLKEDLGRIHVAMYADPLALKPTWLTQSDGEGWDILQLVHVDVEQIWDLSSEASGVETHLYWQRLDAWETRVCLTCESPWAALGNIGHANNEWINPGPTVLPKGKVGKAGSFEVGPFSAGGGYMLLSSVGPTVPRSVVWSTDGPAPSFKLDLETNSRLANILEKGDWQLPRRTWKRWKHDGLDLNVMQILPPHSSWNESAQYPCLIRVYGGPGSQLVSPAFDLTRAHTVVASNVAMPMIMYIIDPRGTGGKGRAFRARVSGRLGMDEADDVIAFAEFLAGGGWGNNVDPMRISVWGWSYGGYLSLRILARSLVPWPKDRPERVGVFSSVAAVAPVTDWMYYDSVYSERYMKLPGHGPMEERHEGEPDVPVDAYYNSSLHMLPKLLTTPLALDPTQPFNLTMPKPRLLIIHGTADDNVHLGNSMLLWSDLLRQLVDPEQVRVQVMPDSDHGMRAQEGKAQWSLYRLLHSWVLHSAYSDVCTANQLDEMIDLSM